MSRVALVALVALAATALADDKPQKPDPQAMMQAWMKHATPGPDHKKLEPLAGSWTFAGKMWEDPSAPPAELTGTTVRTWVLGGRFLSDETKSQVNGMEFQGFGYSGYDNSLKKYVGLWIDNMSTSIMTSTGTVDSSGKVFTNHSETVDPITGKPQKGRDVTTVVSNDEHTMVMYKIADGKEIKAMELRFKRKK